MIGFDRKKFIFPKPWVLVRLGGTAFIMTNNFAMLVGIFWLIFSIKTGYAKELSIFCHYFLIALGIFSFFAFPKIFYGYNVTEPIWNHVVIRYILAPEIVVVDRVKKILDENNISYIYVAGNECQKKFGRRFTKIRHVFEFPHEGIKIIFDFFHGIRGKTTRVHIKPVLNETKASIEQIVRLIENEVPSLETVEPMEKATGE